MQIIKRILCSSHPNTSITLQVLRYITHTCVKTQKTGYTPSRMRGPKAQGLVAINKTKQNKNILIGACLWKENLKTENI